MVAKLNLAFKDVDASTWDKAAIQKRFDLLVASVFSEADKDNDPEHRVAQVGAAIGLLSTHYKLVAKGKESDYAHASEAVQALRTKLSTHAQAVEEFKDITALQVEAEFVQGLTDIVQRWSFLANKITLKLRQMAKF